MSEYHNHNRLAQTDAPTVEQMTVTRVTFRRGVGCCEESPVRMVAAYYHDDGSLIIEHDPMPEILAIRSTATKS